MTRSEMIGPLRAIDRRTFLQVAASSVAIPWLGTRASAAPRSVARALPQCPVGFIDRSDSLIPESDDYTSSQRRVISAERLPNGDPQLAAHGVRLHFHGIRFSEGEVSHTLKLLMLDLEMQVSDSSVDSVPWHFWTYSNQGVLNASGEVIARVPLRKDGSLLFTMTVESGSDSPQTYQAKLTTGSERGVPKLRTGTYFIAVPDIDSTYPAAAEIVRGEDVVGSLDPPALLEGSPTDALATPFSCLVFTVSEDSLEVPAVT